jgi:hypothetical protein
VELPDSRIKAGGEIGGHGAVVLMDAGSDDHVFGLEPTIAGTDDVSAAVPLHRVHTDSCSNLKVEALRVRLQVVGHLARRRKRLRRSGKPHAR